MMNSILEENFKFTSDFFKSAIEKDKLFHAFLLTGNNNVAKYAFALNIAKILNCEGDKNENCNCLNCKWIKDNAHPAVMTFSPIDFVHVNKQSEAKTVITIEQAKYIKFELSKTSTYHRVIIITNAVEGKEAESEYEELKKYKISAPKLVDKDENDKRIWVPRSLKQNIFTTETANALLKTIEEPFERVTFFFLANSPDDLISTIVSRCQTVNIPSSIYSTPDFSLIEKITKNYPAKDNLTSIFLAEEVKKISKENDMSVVEILTLIKKFYEKNLKNYLTDTQNYRNALTFLNKLETAEMQINRYVNVDSVLENLFF